MIEERITSIAQFERIEVDATGIADWRTLVAALAKTMERARGEAVSEHLVARPFVTGSTPLAWRIRRDSDLLKTEADERASIIGRCWVEKLEVECQAPDAVDGATADPINELRRLIDEVVIQSDAYQTEAASIAEELRAQLPPECRGLLGSTEAEFRSALAELMKEGADDVLAQLHAGPEAGEP